jgi:hypothetical protein
MRALKILSLLTVSATVAACSSGFTPKELKGSAILPTGVGKTCSTSTTNPGRTPLRRLSHREYNNTVRDLLMSELRPADRFQTVPPGPTGYTNEAISLTLSEQLVVDYSNAAESLAVEFVNSRTKANGAVSKLASCFLASPVAAGCPKQVISSLATRAFRRPVTDAEVNELVAVYTAGGGSWQGLQDAVVALIDPRFLFLNYESVSGSASASAIDQHSLASRLSYFIWQSMPDDALMKAASSGTLNTPSELQSQIVRMLKDPKAKSLAGVLRDELAGLAPIDSLSNLPLTAELIADIRTESRLFFEDLVANNGNFLDIVNGRTTFVNARLAAHYGWSLPNLTTQFTKVTIPEPERRGVVTQAGFLILRGGAGSFTHPVPRGRWIAKTLLCAEPPPPPPGIPSLESSASGTIRDRLKVHAQGACVGCHKIMDPTGLALELFDPFGKSRKVYRGDGFNPDGANIDASGSLDMPKISFNGPGEMLDAIVQAESAKSCLTRNLLNLALNRLAKSESELCVANTIGNEAMNPNSRLSDLIYKIAATPQFQSQGPEAK